MVPNCLARDPMWRVIPVAVALVAVGAGTETARGAGHPAHYVVFEVDEHGLVEPLFHRFVELAIPPRTMSEGEVESALERDRAGEVVRLELRDGAGVPVFLDAVRPTKWLRGEFHGPTTSGGHSTIESHRFPVARRAFAVRLPVVELGTLVIDSSNRSVFDLDTIASMQDAIDLPPSVSVARGIQRSGSPANRVDVLIMGDGYTASEAAQFDADVSTFQNEFFGLRPYGEYGNYVNAVSLFTASAESGADHPPYDPSCSSNDLSCCADGTANSDPLAGTYVSTAFDGRFCASNIHRLLVVDNALVLAAASAVPDWDQIVVLVNDSTYGGSGGSIAVASTHSLAVDVIRHEYGHSFTGLADEYDSPYPGYPSCNDLGVILCEANVTNATNLADIKWAPWIAPTTPVPTPEGNPAYAAKVGLFEGARYRTTGMYRPRDSQCLMHFLGVPFGEVCTQEYVLVLYRGGWGVPASGIDLIEPGTEVPTPGTVDACDVAFSADLLGPAGGPAVGVEWKIDGVPVPDEASSSYAFSPEAAGSYEIELRVDDTTPLVHAAMAGTDLTKSRRWTVNCGCDIFPLSGSVEPLQVMPTNISWLPHPYATAYDVVRGDLATLTASSGDFEASTEECLHDDLQGSALAYTDSPPPGQGYWFLVRGASCGGSGTFDADGSSQAGTRDAEIGASLGACGSASCGNGIAEGAEACDGTDLRGESCVSQGRDAGTLSCSAFCDALDISRCSVCGNNVCESFGGEDCLSCAQDCNGAQSGNPGNRYCCGDGAGDNPVTCADLRCTAGGNTCVE